MEKEKTNKSGFARVRVQDPMSPEPITPHTGRNQFLKLFYPNGVSLILPVNIDPLLLGSYIHAADSHA
jgi:hypothetical protein